MLSMMTVLRQAAAWPRPWRLACAALVALMVAAVTGASVLASLLERWHTAQAHEAEARIAHAQARALAAQLPQLRARQRQAGAVLAELEQQLPGKQEMADLLSAINQAGLARGLQFELFKPGEPVPQDQYVAMPVSVRLRGTYHAIGAFAADLAHLPRIVTVQSLSLAASKQGPPVLEALLHAFRLPDAAEMAEQQARAARLQKGKPAAAPAWRAPALSPALSARLSPFFAREYDAAQLPDPFGAPQPVLAASTGAGMAAPDLRRVREPLESVAMTSLAMVGSVRHGGAFDALLQAGPRVLRVAVGQYLGPDHGRVTAIEEQALHYREVLQDAGGAWRERRGSLPLQVAGAASAQLVPAEPGK
ncbi:pilus assembly protein PilP [Janthinobacterium aquaticum]|uniref:pilus assembly protein PilP n=1 Tax=Janthinobacterium sp. FT58W TaxID=2654254 RepID=UPI0012652E32|nr:pilus assembly protein PilP [Janthinobacterium sp. FT58W]KAB8041976.1 type 4a pilus biogenesis protein PilO [Janthinobacterium sp. FT58W]